MNAEELGMLAHKGWAESRPHPYMTWVAMDESQREAWRKSAQAVAAAVRAECQGEIERLRAALEPYAAAGREIPQDFPDQAMVLTIAEKWYYFSANQYRAAVAAYDNNRP